MLSPSGILMREQVLELKPMATPLPVLSGMLGMSDPWLQYFLTGEQVRPERSTAFPAHLIATPMDWEDLVLEYQVMEQVEEIRSWLEHGNTLMTDWGLDRTIKAGYRALFFGPAGTGKTLTASLLGKSTDRDVYRVDLSMIVSKYIGETEKTCQGSLTRQRIKTGFCFSTKLIPSLESAQTPSPQTTDMLTSRPGIFCSALRIFREW